MKNIWGVGRGAEFFFDLFLQRSLKRAAIKPLSALRGSFVGNNPAQWLCARNRELHVPEIRLGGDELHSDILLAVARPVDGDDAAFHRLRSVIIHQDQRLPHEDDLFKLK